MAAPWIPSRLSRLDGCARSLGAQVWPRPGAHRGLAAPDGARWVRRFSPRPATPRRTRRGWRSQPPGRPPGTDSLAQQSPSLSRADLSRNRGDSPSGVPSDPGRRTRCPCAPARQIATGGLRVRKQQDTPLDFIPPGGMGAGCMRPPPLRRGCHNITHSAPAPSPSGVGAPSRLTVTHRGARHRLTTTCLTCLTEG